MWIYNEYTWNSSKFAITFVFIRGRSQPSATHSPKASAGGEGGNWAQFAKSLLQFFGLTVMPRCLLDISIFWSCGRTSMHIRRMRSGTPRPSGVSPAVVEAELPVVEWGRRHPNLEFVAVSESPRPPKTLFGASKPLAAGCFDVLDLLFFSGAGFFSTSNSRFGACAPRRWNHHDARVQSCDV